MTSPPLDLDAIEADLRKPLRLPSTMRFAVLRGDGLALLSEVRRLRAKNAELRDDLQDEREDTRRLRAEVDRLERKAGFLQRSRERLRVPAPPPEPGMGATVADIDPDGSS